MTKSEPKSFAMQARTYFGMLPGQTLVEFGQELKELSPEDRRELSEMLEEEGLPVKSVKS